MTKTEYAAAYRKANPEKVAESLRRSYQKHKESRQRKAREYHHANRDARLSVMRQRWTTQPELWAARNAGVDPSTVPPRPDVCDVCSKPPPGKRALGLDHDHATGLFRGWLCHHCNATLGQAQDSVDRLRKLATYLESR